MFIVLLENSPDPGLFSTQTLTFILGGGLLLIALVGGGVEIKELKIPKVDSVPRVLSGIAGVLFLILAIVNPQFSKTNDEKSTSTKASATDQKDAPAPPAETIAQPAPALISSTSDGTKTAAVPKSPGANNSTYAPGQVLRDAKSFAEEIFKLFDQGDYTTIYQRSAFASMFTLESWQEKASQATQATGKVTDRKLCVEEQPQSGVYHLVYAAKASGRDMLQDISVIPKPGGTKNYLVGGLWIRPNDGLDARCPAQQ